MHQNVHHLGDAATIIVAGYVVAGLIAAAAGCLPGNPVRFRWLCVVLGLGMSIWAGKVLVFGGPIIVSAAVLLLLLALTASAVLGTVRAYLPRRTATRLAPPRPHPAARTYTEPASTVPAYTSTASAYTEPAYMELLGAPHPAPVRGHLTAPPAQSRFHGHAIAPAAAFPEPPRFAPQPLRHSPRRRPASDGYATAPARYPANHARPPAPAHPVAAPVRMALAPMTDPSPLQPSAARARHRMAEQPA